MYLPIYPSSDLDSLRVLSWGIEHDWEDHGHLSEGLTTCCGTKTPRLHQAVCQAKPPLAPTVLLPFMWAGLLHPTNWFFNTTQYDTQYRHFCCSLRALRPNMGLWRCELGAQSVGIRSPTQNRNVVLPFLCLITLLPSILELWERRSLSVLDSCQGCSSYFMSLSA